MERLTEGYMDLAAQPPPERNSRIDEKPFPAGLRRALKNLDQARTGLYLPTHAQVYVGFWAMGNLRRALKDLDQAGSGPPARLFMTLLRCNARADVAYIAVCAVHMKARRHC